MKKIIYFKFIIIVCLFIACESPKLNKDNIATVREKDTNRFWMFRKLFLERIDEYELTDNISNSSVIKVRISQVNPVGGYSRIISFVRHDEIDGYSYSYYLKEDCGDQYYSVGDDISSFCKNNFKKILITVESLLDKGTKNYITGNPCKWVIELLKDGEYNYTILEVGNMFEVPNELKELITLIKEQTVFDSEEYKKMVCSEIEKKELVSQKSSKIN